MAGWRTCLQSGGDRWLRDERAERVQVGCADEQLPVVMCRTCVSPNRRHRQRSKFHCSGRDARCTSAPRPDPYVRLSRIRLVWEFLCQGCITPFLSCFVASFFCSTRAASILLSRPHITIAVAHSDGQGRRNVKELAAAPPPGGDRNPDRERYIAAPVASRMLRRVDAQSIGRSDVRSRPATESHGGAILRVSFPRFRTTYAACPAQKFGRDYLRFRCGVGDTQLQGPPSELL